MSLGVVVPPIALRTSPFAHYNVAWSPFHAHLLALASSANYGLIGNGRAHLCSLSGAPAPIVPAAGADGRELRLDKFYKTQDGLYDLAWSEIHENQLVTASGDGSLKLWDIMLNDLPIRAWHEHSREAFSVDWSNIDKTIFASSSWDGLVKIWTTERPTSIQTIAAHQSCVYQAMFSPHTPNIIASCSTDGSIKIFDLRTAGSGPLPPQSSIPSAVPPAPPPGSSVPSIVIPAHPAAEILSIDWNKYRPWVLVSGSTDKMIKVWDARNVKPVANGPQVGGNCEISLHGHEYAVRKVQWSPHRADLIASAGYDMTCRVWSTTPNGAHPPLRTIHDKHTEFVTGCAWSLYEEGLLASCSWDHSVHLFRPYNV
ncbi:WD40 repeat-like protein [Cantharellus anzutake]|uniref:WD40 repeat-like protein n=1 Tax=Cantharellus anzutake TaxID=1750568 RepID=UPI0019060C65|nr:WD40 repeat-like protein [Cantharellus anzutake]KAF8329335.1 WD40 repeat-like protein [Cantharellus anzutake]